MTWLNDLDDLLIDRVAQPTAERIAPHIGLGPHGQAWVLRRVSRVMDVIFLSSMFIVSAALAAVHWKYGIYTALCALALYGIIKCWRTGCNERYRQDAEAEASQVDIWGRGARGSRVDGFHLRWASAAFAIFFCVAMAIPPYGLCGLLISGSLTVSETLEFLSRILHACRSTPPAKPRHVENHSPDAASHQV